MKYLLDTDHISYLQRRSSVEYAVLAARMALHSPSDFALSIISFHEQVLGASTFISRAKKGGDVIRGYALVGEVLAGYLLAPVLAFDGSAMAEFDGLRTQRIRVGTMDLRIAAIALSNKLTLLTRNTADFAKIPRLMTDNWTV